MRATSRRARLTSASVGDPRHPLCCGAASMQGDCPGMWSKGSAQGVLVSPQAPADTSACRRPEGRHRNALTRLQSSNSPARRCCSGGRNPCAHLCRSSAADGARRTGMSPYLGVRAKSRSEASAAIAAGGGLQDPHAIVWNPLRIILCLWAPARLARKHFRLGCLWRRLHLCTALVHTSSSSSSGCCQVNPNRDFSQSQKRKQGLSGWKVAKAILDSLRENMNLPGGTVAAVHVMYGYDSSVVEQALRSASSVPSQMVCQVVWVDFDAGVHVTQPNTRPSRSG